MARLCGARTVNRVIVIVGDFLRNGETGPLGRLVERSFDDWDEHYGEIHRRFEVLHEALAERPDE